MPLDHLVSGCLICILFIGFMTRIKKVLECVCHSCAKLKVDLDNPKFKRTQLIKDPKARLRAVWEVCKPRMVCESSFGGDGNEKDPTRSGCGSRQPTVKKEGLKFVAVYKQSGDDNSEPTKQVLSTAKIHSIFKRISDEDCRLLGLDPEYARPDWMLVTVLPVPPPAVRPSIQVDGSSRGEDDLTYKLADIIQANLNLRKNELEGNPAHIIAEFEQLLQYHIVTYMDNDVAGIPQSLQKNGRPVKSIRSRLKGKEGRLRGNLMGKRVDFSARTVITGDPNLSLDEVGVPKSIARILTFPEVVTPFN
eukprot:Partr_v1_DN28937_c1_g1_i1_m26239 putative DNA-directed RNA Polymerase